MSRRPASAEPALRRLEVCSWIALATVGVVIAVITLWPGPPAPDGQLSLREFLWRAHQHGLPTWINYTTVEFASNVVMFVPIGLFGALALRRRRWLIVPAAVLASVTIEVVQAMALPLRFGSVRDVVANTLGALLGCLLAAAVVAQLHRRARRRQPTRPAPAPAYR